MIDCKSYFFYLSYLSTDLKVYFAEYENIFYLASSQNSTFAHLGPDAKWLFRVNSLMLKTALSFCVVPGQDFMIQDWE